MSRSKIRYCRVIVLSERCVIVRLCEPFAYIVLAAFDRLMRARGETAPIALLLHVSLRVQKLYVFYKCKYSSQLTNLHPFPNMVRCVFANEGTKE